MVLFHDLMFYRELNIIFQYSYISSLTFRLLLSFLRLAVAVLDLEGERGPSNLLSTCLVSNYLYLRLSPLIRIQTTASDLEPPILKNRYPHVLKISRFRSIIFCLRFANLVPHNKTLNINSFSSPCLLRKHGKNNKHRGETSLQSIF